MRLVFLAKNLEIYSATLSTRNNVTLYYGDSFDFPEIDAERILRDFPNDFVKEADYKKHLDSMGSTVSINVEKELKIVDIIIKESGDINDLSSM